MEKKYDAQFEVMFTEIRQLIEPPKANQNMSVKGYRIPIKASTNGDP